MKMRSSLESAVEHNLKTYGILHDYEKEILKYKVPETTRKYIPDFTIQLPKEKDIILESKGRLTSEDRKKMLLVKEQHPTRTIIFIFGRATNKLRKGSKTTYASWCDKHDFLYTDIKDFKKDPIKCISNLLKTKKPGKLPKSQKTKNKS